MTYKLKVQLDSLEIVFDEGVDKDDELEVLVFEDDHSTRAHSLYISRVDAIRIVIHLVKTFRLTPKTVE